MSHAMSPPVWYQPKGSMCAACNHKDRGCGHLQFYTYPEIERDTLFSKDDTIIVKCVEFDNVK